MVALWACNLECLIFHSLPSSSPPSPSPTFFRGQATREALAASKARREAVAEDNTRLAARCAQAEGGLKKALREAAEGDAARAAQAARVSVSTWEKSP